MPASRSHCAPLIVLFGALSACGGGSTEGAAVAADAAVRWIEPKHTHELGAARDPELVRLLPVPTGLEPWEILEGEGHYVEDDGKPALRFEAKGARVLRIPGPFDPSRFNRIVVHGEVPTADRLSFRFRQAGEVVCERKLLPLLPGELELGVTLEDLGLVQGLCDDLLIEFEGRSDWSQYSGLELQLLPPEHGLPLGSADWVTIEGESRLAIGLRSGERLEAQLADPEGARLEFSVAIPPLGRAGVEGAELRITLQAADRAQPLVKTLPLAQLLAAPEPWADVSLDLAPWAGGDVLWSAELVGGERSACVVERPAYVQRQANPPTVMLITSDTHRRDYLGISGSGIEVDTPHLDALAQHGLLFRDAYASTNITVPSHASLLTGVHPRATGVIDNSDSLADAARTLAEAFGEAGYTCLASVSAAHLGPSSSGLGQGFARFSLPHLPQRDSSLTIAALEPWLEGLEGRPLFIWLHLFDAHTPYAPPDAWRERYYDAQRDPFDPELPKPQGYELPSWAKHVRDLDFIESKYRGEVSYLDERVGQLLEHPRLAQARIALTSDHGESLGENQTFWSHDLLYPSTLGVPLILSGPGLPSELRGLQVERGVSHLDIGRTLLDWIDAGGSDFPGRNLFELAAEAGSEPRYAVAVRGESASIELGGWFLLMHLIADYRRAPLGGPELHELELYDLNTDPSCAKNRVEDEPERVLRMRALLIDFLTRTPDTGWESDAPVSTQTADLIRALGYVEGQTEHVMDGWFDIDCGCDWCARLR